ncbi:hypothetical protein JQC92_21635 [Shewanella sp. 202IG2-18]|uniref:hypothetical protein n=1 Tax=Parashewanella hymeniacidonis TaxID=2807618 RepID=UPI001961DFF6|nr:hypothetical protein [Parashewanella hymeniacidonis]MBM7074585.1 hypothetical protein [Parashewanella hymeniacidonis]
MPKLSKEETIAALTAAIKQHEGRDVSIEQKGSWYKIDDGKSLRFSELEAMLESFGAAPAESKKEVKAEAKPKAEKKKPAKVTKKKAESKSGGMLPKEYWLNYLNSQGSQFTLPRGF